MTALFNSLLSLLVLLSLATAALSALLPAIGVCLSGMEYGRVPGTPGQDYAWPTADEWQYFHSKKFTMVRMPFKWERIYPTLNGPLDPFTVNVLKAQLSIAASLNMSATLDCHNYARWNGAILNGTTGPLTTAVFADFWLKMATEFRGHPGLKGYGSVPAHTCERPSVPHSSAAIGSPSAVSPLFAAALRSSFTLQMHSVLTQPSHRHTLTSLSCSPCVHLLARPHE